jgi:hypothetical protein
MLDSEQAMADIVGQGFCQHQPNKAVEFIDVSHRLDTRCGFGQAIAIAQARCPVVAGSRVDLA